MGQPENTGDSISFTRTLPTEERITPIRNLLDAWTYSIERPEEFWAEQAGQLDWFKTWERVLEWEGNHARWFIGGSLTASHNCLDRHVKTATRNKAAIIWEGEPGDRRVLTYHCLYRDVNRFALALRELGVSKGTPVALYMPMIPELPIAMLACARLGAPFTQVYSGFSTGSLAERVQHVGAKVVVTSDGLWRRGKVVDLKGIVDRAVDECPTVKRVVTVRRTAHGVEMRPSRDV
jgi:acetyl-CoA synthetase